MDEESHSVSFEFVVSNPSDKSSSSFQKTQVRSHAARVASLRKRQGAKANPALKWVAEDPRSTKSRRHPAPQKILQLLSELPRSLSPLDYGRAEELVEYSKETVPFELQANLDRACEQYYPKLLYGMDHVPVQMIVRAWRDHAAMKTSFFLLHIVCAANAAHADGQLISEDMQQHLITYNELVHDMLALQLSNARGRVSDPLLMAMIVLGMNSFPFTPQLPELYTASPLSTYLKLNIFGSLSANPAILKKVIDLVNERGGLKNVDVYGINRILLLVNLSVSSQLGIAPFFPWTHSFRSILKCGRYRPDSEAIDMSLVAGTGFDILLNIDPTFVLHLRAAADTTVALDHYHKPRLNPPLISDLIDAATETQHGLLSIATSSPMPRSQDGIGYLHHMCTIAALIYSDMVLFPLPATCVVKPRLAGELRRAIQTYLQFEQNEQNEPLPFGEALPELVLWITMLGRLAAAGTPHSDWFSHKLRYCLFGTPHIGNWQDFKMAMSKYLWWDYILDEPAWKWLQQAYSSTLEHFDVPFDL